MTVEDKLMNVREALLQTERHVEYDHDVVHIIRSVVDSPNLTPTFRKSLKSLILRDVRRKQKYGS